ncbi:ABC transporter substrate-binding protein [Nonomuraea gerenzanensis]|uniref:N-Acetyl-D-glucosamine ABC transport system, sugar-binding protein n=1 Tax=Nonomuraea gerenzanensis TaxID=93944 RepID=A0A1M4EEC4_9ACTN|nr:sugar ABC transporter substrate-binding protein [Nonomuraea gerenzanensis]UBU08874.1 sugar ABC transporter substrate-binding protein [Nonomuraea gerenzanensis]SBO97239.1 N-Acetyl-D-glucosamine ABC transport system, sugar-binding protein [Nonomuraea gerenzanensis]
MKAPLATLALACLLTVTACGGGAAPAAQGPQPLRMSIWTSNEAHLKLFKDIAAEYRKSHPRVGEITFDPIPFENYTTTLTTQIAGGNAPDLAWILENAAPDFVGSGALVPLKGKIENAGELVPAATRLWERDGELYAYPFSTSPFGVFVNTDLVKAAGQKAPRDLIKAGQWDWEHANEINKAVAAKGKNGLTILNFDYKAWDNLATVWQGWGAKAWSDDGGTCQFNAPEMVEAMTFLHKSIFTDKAMPGPGTAVDFFSGDTAMAVAQISRAAMLEDATFTWDLVPLPAGPKGEYAVIGQAGIGVLKKSPKAELAADFLAYFTNAANSAKLAAYFPPARSSLLTADTMAKTSPMLNGDQLQEVVIDGIEQGVVKPSHTGQAELAQTARAALDPLWKPDADVKAVLDGVCAKIQPLLGG